MGGWKFNQDRPIYQQIIDQIEAMILSGEYKPGDKLESVRELASMAGVNPNTMQKALQEMETKELVQTKRTSGRFITEDEDKIRALRHAAADQKTDGYIGEMKQLGYSISDSIQLLESKKPASKAIGNLDEFMKGELDEWKQS